MRRTPRFFDRRKPLAGDVLDEPDQQGIAVVRVAHDRRQRRDPRLARRPPPTLAGDDLVATLGTRPYDDRLEDALMTDRLGEARGCLRLEALAGLARVRLDRVDRELQQLGRAATTDENFETAAETAADGLPRSTSSIATFQ